MKDILKNLLDAKENLYKKQRFFFKSLRQRYPNLVLEDTTLLKDKLNSEIEFLLSSSLKPKTGRILIEAPDLGYKKQVVLTRNPGLKYPHESYSVFKPTDIIEIDEQGNISKKDYDEKLNKIYLSILKTSGQIDQEKLEAFYDFLQEAILWIKELAKFLDEEISDKESFIPVDEHRIRIYNQGFRFEIVSSRGRTKEYEEIEYSKITSYDQDSYDEEKSEINDQKALLKVWEQFEDFDKALTSAENSKKELIDKGKDLINRLEDYNKPFKLLIKLLQN